MKILIGGTDKGLVRTINQDRYALGEISDTLAFAVLCDGMGGENGGHVASEIAVNHAREALARDLAEGMGESSLRAVMVSAITTANDLVYDAAQKNPALAGMGTTMIVCVFTGGTLYIACVGDSRVYSASPAGAHQLTHDHTVVQMLLDIGEISEEDARNHPKRHFITRAVGVSPQLDVDFIVQPFSDEIALICSDGLYNYMEPEEIYPLLQHCVEAGSVTPLIDLALESGGADNVTAIVAC